MGPLAATLLCYYEPERAYASLVQLHDSYNMHSIFSPGFPGLLEAIYVQERLTEQMLPAVYGAFKKHMVSTTSYATKWYITLFANSVPFQTQLRLWDAFLLEGHDIFVVVAVAIVWAYRGERFTVTSSSSVNERGMARQIILPLNRPTSRRFCLSYHRSSYRRMRTLSYSGSRRSSVTRRCGQTWRSGDRTGVD